MSEKKLNVAVIGSGSISHLHLKGVLELARTANDEAVALEREAKTLFETTESQRQMNKNKKFQKDQLTKDGYTEFKEFYKEALKQ